MEVLRQRAQGLDPISDHKAAKHRRRAAAANKHDSSFAAAARAYIEEHAKPKVRGWRELARLLGLDPDTDDLEPVVNGLCARWGDRDIRFVDAHDVWSVVDEARRVSTPGIEPRRVGSSEARARALHAALSAFFGWAARHRRVDANPCAGIHRPPAPKARERVLTSAETVAFWKATDKLSRPFGAVLKLLLLTGARLTEVSELKWSELTEDRAGNSLAGVADQESPAPYHSAGGAGARNSCHPAED